MKSLSFYYRFKNNLLPKNLFLLFNEIPTVSHRYPTSSMGLRHTHLLQESFTRTFNAENCLTIALPKMINAFDTNLTSKVNTHSFNGFKNYAKNYFISNYNNVICDIENCFSCQVSNVPRM